MRIADRCCLGDGKRRATERYNGHQMIIVCGRAVCANSKIGTQKIFSARRRNKLHTSPRIKIVSHQNLEMEEWGRKRVKERETKTTFELLKT